MFHKPPIDLIRLVVKTGFITKDIWRRHIFGRGGERWLHATWRLLVTRGYFNKYPAKRFHDVLVLNRKNQVVRDAITEEPVPPPVPAQMAHDEIILDGILCLEKSGAMAYWQTEAELKKLNVNDYKIETQGQLVKYPDLLIHTKRPLPEFTVAIELERTLKTRRRYVQILGAYASTRRIDALVIVVSNSAIEKTIRDVMQETYFPDDRIPVVFFSEREWLTESPLVLNQACRMALKAHEAAA